ncbi:MAG TPA: formate dehydrogenase accessory protein FdhE [Rubrivivax sp.]|nr:formate dehydrogenase accessory protein FdhE [Rubrivivax sp.]
MSTGSAATVTVMSPEEIASRGSGDMPFLRWPERSTVFAERAMRLRQLAPGHAMADFLVFMAEVAQAQQNRLTQGLRVPLPDAAALDLAAQRGLPPLSATDWPRDPAWHALLRNLVADVRPHAPAALAESLGRLEQADPATLERQADALLHGVMAGVDLATAPVVAAALQVLWTHLLLEVQRGHRGLGQALGRLDDETICPGCGSRPTASMVRSEAGAPGQRYLHCSLCNLQWHMVRIKCSHCTGITGLAYHALDSLDGADDGPDAKDGAASRAAKAVVQAETCDECHHYLKIMHTDRDPFVDPVADDLASLTLDLLVSEAGMARHGVNLMLLFGDPVASAGTPPDPAGQ